MKESHSLFDTITSSLAPVHSEGHKFVAVGVVATVLLMWLWAPLGWLAALITLAIAYFFRDPPRMVPSRAGLLTAPADGRICAVDTARPPEESGLGEEVRPRVSIFLSVLDVHITRAPLSGEVVRSSYMPGLFLNAELDKASEDNERQSFVIEPADGEPVCVVMIAGLVARRIVAFVKEHDRIGVGERLGLIRFGSRVDLYLPQGAIPQVAVGQRAVGGETVLADLNSQEPTRESRRI